MGEVLPDDAAPAKPHYHGHRDRLRAKFLTAVRADTPDTVADYELLELLLFLAIPQRDVKPLAKELIARFRSLGGVFAASPEQLMQVKGIKETGVAAIKAVQVAAIHMIREDVMGQPVLSSWDRLLDYCHATMAYRETEQFRILFLDRKNRLIADELQQKGTVDHTPVYPREVVKRALELQASAVILVHNHPSGDPQPSKADIDMTRVIQDAMKPLSLVLHDHVVIGRSGYCSFRADGLL
ncbi:MAG: DNA repair protein RadC [Rhodospirillaceae bacterium]